MSNQTDPADIAMVLAKTQAFMVLHPEIVSSIPILNTIVDVCLLKPAEEKDLVGSVLVLRMEAPLPIPEVKQLMELVKAVFKFEVVVLPKTIDLMKIDRDKMITELESVLNFLKREM